MNIKRHLCIPLTSCVRKIQKAIALLHFIVGLASWVEGVASVCLSIDPTERMWWWLLYVRQPDKIQSTCSKLYIEDSIPGYENLAFIDYVTCHRTGAVT